MRALFLKILTKKSFSFLIWVMINKIDSDDDDDPEYGFNDDIDENEIWKKVTYVGYETDYDNLVTILFDLFDGVGFMMVLINTFD